MGSYRTGMSLASGQRERGRESVVFNQPGCALPHSCPQSIGQNQPHATRCEEVGSCGRKAPMGNTWGAVTRPRTPSFHFPGGRTAYPAHCVQRGTGAGKPWLSCGGQRALTGTSNKAGCRGPKRSPPHPWDPGAFGSCHHLGQSPGGPEAFAPFFYSFIHSFIHCSFTNTPEASLHPPPGARQLGLTLGAWQVDLPGTQRSLIPVSHPRQVKGSGGPEEHLRAAVPATGGAQVVCRTTAPCGN